MSNQATRLAEALRDLQARYEALFWLYAKDVYHSSSDPKSDLDLALATSRNALLALVQPARRPLPAGSVIAYMDMEATVIRDEGGETLFVETQDGAKENWAWECEGVTCKVDSVPEPSVQPAVSEEAPSVREHVLQLMKERKVGEPVLCTWAGCREVWKAVLHASSAQSSAKNDEGMQHE